MDKLQLEIPEGIIIDVENSDLTKGVIKLKAKDIQKKWEDFGKVEGYYIDSGAIISDHCSYDADRYSRNILPTKSLANAMLALCQLLQWRNKVWKEDCDYCPNWNTGVMKFCITSKQNNISIETPIMFSRILTFSSMKIADKFLKDHRDLIETAKELL